MKSEATRTGLFCAAAIAVMATAAWFEPESRKSEIFSDAGEAFFPQLRDIQTIKAIEVVDFDENDATARPLKVEFRKNRWVLSSHGDYPAEARDRLAKTAGAMVDIKKDAAVSDRIEDQGTYGVIDPLDTRNPSLTGRGKRVALRDSGGVLLAEMILGHPVKDKPGYRYVRLPGQKRTYAIKTDADPSARFEDWVEADLLKLGLNDIAKITLRTYSYEEQIGRPVNLQQVVMVPNQENWDAKAKTIAATLSSLRVTGARPKPPSLASQLRTGQFALSLDIVMSLRQRGFFITPFGQLLANEGEMFVETTKGLSYRLMFGEVVSDVSSAKQKESRYLMVLVTSRNPELQAQVSAVSGKFADWYYIISGNDFSKLHPNRAPKQPVQIPIQLPMRPAPSPAPAPPRK